MTVEEKHKWSGYAHWKRKYQKHETYEEEGFYWTEGATNPPKLWDSRDYYLCTTMYCDDDTYTIPIQYLGTGLVRGHQHRVLYGVEYTC